MSKSKNMHRRGAALTLQMFLLNRQSQSLPSTEFPGLTTDLLCAAAVDATSHKREGLIITSSKERQVFILK